MLNLNYNINNTLRNQRNFLKGKVDYRWRRTITTAAGIQSGSIIFGTGSIDFVPFDVETLFLSGTYAVGELSSGSAVGQAVDIKITGSGEWPTTGSNSMYILIGSSLGFNQSEVLTMSAEADDMYLSGSVISSSFFPVLNNEYNIDFGLNHTKGNLYNPLVLWKTMQEEDISGLSVDLPINGYTSSFNIVKNENELLVNVVEVSGSFSSSFEYLYNFGVTASLTASINNVTGSTTMSFILPESGLNEVYTFFNPTTTIATATGSFVATSDVPYNLTASVEYNKGNLSVADINYRAFQTSTTEDLEGNATNLNGVTSSFQLKKDIAQKVLIPNVSGAASVGSYNNENSFNQTASLSQYVNNTTGSVTMSIIVPESGINVTQSWFNPSTTTATLTSSFVAQTVNGAYNVTASVINNKGNESNSNINYLITGSGNSPSAIVITKATSSYNLEKDIAILVSGSALSASISGTYKNDYSFDQTASLTSSFIIGYNLDSSSKSFGVAQLQIPEVDVDIYSYVTESILSASYKARTDIDDYNTTASFNIIQESFIDYVLIGGGGRGAAAQSSEAPGGGGGAGAVITGSLRLRVNEPYRVQIGGSDVSSSFAGPLVPIDNLDLYPSASDAIFLIAPAGGIGGLAYGGFNGNNGGSGGGGAAAGIQAPANFPTILTGTGGFPVSSSIISTSSYDLVEQDPYFSGNNGGAGSSQPRPGFAGYNYGVAGGGGGWKTAGLTAARPDGGSGSIVTWLSDIINSGSIGGGGGGGSQSSGGAQSQFLPGRAVNGGGSFFLTVNGNGVNYTGGGGAGGCGNGGVATPGLGGSGSMSIRYPGLPRANGGIVEYIDGYTIHTFTASGEFAFTSQSFQPVPPTTSSFDVEYVVLGGGGAGGSGTGAGGGGAAQLVSGSFSLNLASSSSIFNIVVGDGGLAERLTESPFGKGGRSGSLSIVSSSNYSLVSFGGAGGVGASDNNFTSSVSASGGGGGASDQLANTGSGVGFTSGGIAFFGTNNIVRAGGGGGGYSENGFNATGSSDLYYSYPGNGGDGIQLFITSSQPTVLGGGGGGVWNNTIGGSSSPGLGGNGGGGNGAYLTANYYESFYPATSGLKNTGAGGGGASDNQGSAVGPIGGPFKNMALGGNGGSGVVYLRFPKTINQPLFAGNPPVITEDGNSYVYKFITGSSQIKFL